jgi:hypothetical protein
VARRRYAVSLQDDDAAAVVPGAREDVGVSYGLGDGQALQTQPLHLFTIRRIRCRSQRQRLSAPIASLDRNLPRQGRRVRGFFEGAGVQVRKRASV